METTTPIVWQEDGEERQLRWQSENLTPAPKKVLVVNNELSADKAYRLACEGNGLLWRGDFHLAKQLLQAMARRVDRKIKTSDNITEAFHLHRQSQAQRARILGMLMIEVNADFTIPLRRAPDIQQACLEVYGQVETNFAVSLREVLGIIGAHQWRINGLEIDGLYGRLYPHYGVFSPVRGEYLQLIAQIPLPQWDTAFDIGTGTGVIAAILAQRGIKHVIATDQDPRALACATANITQLGLSAQVEIQEKDMFPEGKAGLIVCNPPWLPAKPNAGIEYAIYDEKSKMLKSFLNGLQNHLLEHGQGWLVMSNFAELLGLRKLDELKDWINQADLAILGQHSIKPKHKKTENRSDPLHQARAQEVTSVWVLTLKDSKFR